MTTELLDDLKYWARVAHVIDEQIMDFHQKYNTNTDPMFFLDRTDQYLLHRLLIEQSIAVEMFAYNLSQLEHKLNAPKKSFWKKLFRK